MLTFRQMVNKLRYSGGSLAAYDVGYVDRFAADPLEMSLTEFLLSDVPEHRARYLRRGEQIVWDRRKSGEPPAG